MPKVKQLYVVTRAPAARFAAVHNLFQRYVMATSSSGAVREAKHLDPDFFDPAIDKGVERGRFKAPRADLVTQGPRYVYR